MPVLADAHSAREPWCLQCWLTVSKSWTKVLSPLRIPCVGRQTASLGVVGYELMCIPGCDSCQAWQLPVMLVSTWVCRAPKKSECVFVRARVNWQDLFCMSVDPCCGSSPTLNRGLFISFCSVLPSFYPLRVVVLMLQWCVRFGGLVLMSLFLSLSISTAWVGGTSACGWKNLLHWPQ